MRKEENVGWFVFLALVLIISIPISIALNGLVLTYLWGWFIVPVFSVKSLTVLQAIGIGLVIRFLTYNYEYKNKKEKNYDELNKEMVAAIIATYVFPLTALLFGFVVRWLMI